MIDAPLAMLGSYSDDGRDSPELSNGDSSALVDSSYGYLGYAGLAVVVILLGLLVSHLIGKRAERSNQPRLHRLVVPVAATVVMILIAWLSIRAINDPAWAAWILDSSVQ